MEYSDYNSGNLTSSAGLEAYHFIECGRISFDKSTEKLAIETDEVPSLRHRRGTVYLWALNKFNEPKLEVQYIGSTADDYVYRSNVWQGALNHQVKARREAKERGDDEEAIKAAFKESTARKMRRLLIDALTKGEISVWAKVAEEVRIYGRQRSLFKTEEDVLIELLAPALNGYKDLVLEALDQVT